MEDYSDIMITRKHINEFNKKSGFKKILAFRDLWGITVGLMISGLFFEWSQALRFVKPGSLLILISGIFLFYILYMPVLSRLAVSYPYAGGGYAYSRIAFGSFWGFMTGILKVGEFACITGVLLSYLESYLKMLHIPMADYVKMLIFAILMVFHSTGTKKTVFLQLLVTTIGISALLLLFMGIDTTGALSFVELTEPSHLPYGMAGALPFVLWLFLGIDVTVLTVEETKNPGKQIPLAFLASLLMLLFLLLGTILICLACVPAIFLAGASFPLHRILMLLQEDDKVLQAVFSFLSLSAFLAGVNAGLIGYSRQVFSLGRAGYLPSVLGKIHEKSKAPYAAVFSSALALLLSGFFPAISLIKMACFFALISYLLTALSYFPLVIRKMKKGKRRVLQKGMVGLVLLMCAVGFFGMLFLNLLLFGIFSGILILAAVYYLAVGKKKVNQDAPEEVEANSERINIIITDMIKS